MKRKTDIAVPKSKLKNNLQHEGKYGNYNLFLYENRFYAVDISLNEDEALDIIKEKKAISANSEDKLIENIVSAENWANQRGMYNINDQSESNKRYLRANSFDTYNEKIAKNFKEPVKIKTPQGLFMVDGKELNLKDRIKKKFIDFTKSKNINFINAVSVNAIPELIFMYENYNIVEYDKIFYGIPLSSGSINLVEADLSKITGLVTGNTVKEVMTQIDEIKVSLNFNDTEKIEDNKINESNITDRMTSNVTGIDSDDEINKSSVDSLPVLIKQLTNENIVRYKNRYYIIPHSVGPIDLDKIDENKRKEFLSSEFLEEVEKTINDKIS